MPLISEGFVRPWQADAAESVGEMLRQVLSIERLNTALAFASATEFPQRVEANRVQLAQINDHFAEAEISVGWQKVPAPNAAGAERAFDISRLE